LDTTCPFCNVGSDRIWIENEHALVTDLVRGAWLRFVRQQNPGILGETTDLSEFLFDSERIALAVVRPVLMDLQRGRCFYCGDALRDGSVDVDHFIRWSRYSADLGHNFVLADRRCNNQKRDRIAAVGSGGTGRRRIGDRFRYPGFYVRTPASTAGGLR
jgi:5-methylcytosine-specific restriction endonuclease McrA